MTSNVQKVMDVYAAFGRGDVQSILAHFAEDVDCEYEGGSTDVPYLQRRHGRAGVLEAFAAIAGLEVVVFAPKMILENASLVAAIVEAEFIVRATGKRIVERDEVHLWWFDDDGRVARFKHAIDTAQHAAAHRA
jgi:uncharacterized protein